VPNEQKTPLTLTLPAVATAAAISEIRKRGTPLPGSVVAVSGPIVTVAFNVATLTLPRVQMPIFGPEYIRYPVQVGDKGVAFPMPVYIGNVTGLGPDVPANVDQLQGNLSLMWFPCGNKNWTASPNANATVIYGKTGGVIIINTIGGSVEMEVTSSGITITGGNITIGPNTTIDSRLFLAHTHSGVQTGTGVSGPVV
jgi:hypothetical protein